MRSEKIKSKASFPRKNASAFPYELFAASGASDTDLAAAAGNTDRLLTVRTAEVAMLAVCKPGHPVFDPLTAKYFRLPAQITTVFQKTLIRIPGEKTEEIAAEKNVGEQGHDHADDAADQPEAGEDHANDAQNHRRGEQKNIQLVHAVAPDHEAPHGCGKALKHATEHSFHHLAENEIRRNSGKDRKRNKHRALC